jgi:hypothetical protein
MRYLTLCRRLCAFSNFQAFCSPLFFCILVFTSSKSSTAKSRSFIRPGAVSPKRLDCMLYQSTAKCTSMSLSLGSSTSCTQNKQSPLFAECISLFTYSTCNHNTARSEGTRSKHGVCWRRIRYRMWYSIRYRIRYLFVGAFKYEIFFTTFIYWRMCTSIVSLKDVIALEIALIILIHFNIFAWVTMCMSCQRPKHDIDIVCDIVYDIVSLYRMRYRIKNIRYRIRYRMRYRMISFDNCHW